MRHEEVAAFAAGADAHLTGSIAVCAGSCGPGVSVIVIPGDVALQAAVDAPTPTSVDLLPPMPTVVPKYGDILELAALLNGADRITMLCGSGCAGAHDQVVPLAGKLKSPIVYALRGKEHIEWGNPYSVDCASDEVIVES